MQKQCHVFVRNTTITASLQPANVGPLQVYKIFQSSNRSQDCKRIWRSTQQPALIIVILNIWQITLCHGHAWK